MNLFRGGISSPETFAAITADENALHDLVASPALIAAGKTATLGDRSTQLIFKTRGCPPSFT